MKKRFIVSALLLSFLLNTACTGSGETPEFSSEAQTNETSETSVSETTLAELNNAEIIFPDLDGSTSAIALDIGLRMGYLGIDEQTAEAQVIHTTTHQSFDRLLKKECDGILSVPLSAEQVEKAKEAEIEIEMIPIALESFVFIVNADNPIDSLSSDDLRNIYSGKITNWKELGGNDAEIIPYQRNLNSGSQTYMTAFMGDVELVDAPLDLRPGSMGGLVDMVALYENSINAIGYSVYSYAANMYVNGNDIKFLKIDGIEPCAENFSNKTYPLLSNTYLIFDKAELPDSPVRKLADWLNTEDGRKAVVNSGYIPVEPLSTVTETAALNLLNSVSTKGTGIEKPVDFTTPSVYYTVDYTKILKDKKSDEIKAKSLYLWQTSKKGVYKTITGLNNKELEERINSDIYEAMLDMSEVYPDFFDYAAKQNDYFKDSQLNSIMVEYVCKNGYLSVFISLQYFSGYYVDSFIYDYRVLIYDLYSGKKLSAADLFYKDADFLPDINAKFAKEHDRNTHRTDGPGFEFRTDFMGIVPGTEFTLDKIILPKNNIYMQTAFSYNIKPSAEYFVPLNPRDMAGIWENDVVVKFVSVADNDYQKIGDVSLYLLPENAPVSDTVREKSTALVQSLLDKETRKAFFYENNIFYDEEYIEESLENGENDIGLICYGDMYIKVSVMPNIASYSYELYSGKTFEPLKLDDIFIQGFEEEAEWLYYSEDGMKSEIVEAQDYSKLRIEDVLGLEYIFDENPNITVRFRYTEKKYDYYTVSVPRKYIKW